MANFARRLVTHLLFVLASTADGVDLAAGHRERGARHSARRSACSIHIHSGVGRGRRLWNASSTSALQTSPNNRTSAGTAAAADWDDCDTELGVPSDRLEFVTEKNEPDEFQSRSVFATPDDEETSLPVDETGYEGDLEDLDIGKDMDEGMAEGVRNVRNAIRNHLTKRVRRKHPFVKKLTMKVAPRPIHMLKFSDLWAVAQGDPFDAEDRARRDRERNARKNTPRNQSTIMTEFKKGLAKNIRNSQRRPQVRRSMGNMPVTVNNKTTLSKSVKTQTSSEPLGFLSEQDLSNMQEKHARSDYVPHLPEEEPKWTCLPEEEKLLDPFYKADLADGWKFVDICRSGLNKQRLYIVQFQDGGITNRKVYPAPVVFEAQGKWEYAKSGRSQLLSRTVRTRIGNQDFRGEADHRVRTRLPGKEFNPYVFLIQYQDSKTGWFHDIWTWRQVLVAEELANLDNELEKEFDPVIGAQIENDGAYVTFVDVKRSKATGDRVYELNYQQPGFQGKMRLLAQEVAEALGNVNPVTKDEFQEDWATKVDLTRKIGTKQFTGVVTQLVRYGLTVPDAYKNRISVFQDSAKPLALYLVQFVWKDMNNQMFAFTELFSREEVVRELGNSYQCCCAKGNNGTLFAVHVKNELAVGDNGWAQSALVKGKYWEKAVGDQCPRLSPVDLPNKENQRCACIKSDKNAGGIIKRSYPWLSPAKCGDKEEEKRLHILSHSQAPADGTLGDQCSRLCHPGWNDNRQLVTGHC